MALRIDYETQYGIDCNYAHCIVINARVSKKVKEQEVDGETVITRVFDVHYNGKIFATDDAYADGASPIGGFNGKFEMDKGGTKKQYNIIKQCYLHLKEQEGCSDGTDC